MHRSAVRVAGLAGALALATACNPTAPTTAATATPLTETFTALLTANGADVFPFPAASAGTVTVTLSTISPDAGLTLEVQLGTWNGSTCALQFSTDPAVVGASVTAQANAAGNLCARVADSHNQITTTEAITVTVTHF
jgi:hypothetical protein